jgi:hypothetical protein
MSLRLREGLVAAVLLVLAACGGRDGTSWKLADDLHLPVQVDGKPTAPIDARRLERLAPDFRDEERLAWRLSRFFGDAYGAKDATVTVRTKAGVSVSFEDPSALPEGRVLVLSANRKGEIVVAEVDPAVPFPAYHGRGGGRGRNEGGGQRVREVVAVDLETAGTKGGKEKTMIRIEVDVDGKERIWTEDELASVEPLAVPGDSREGTRDAFSLHTLLASLVSPAAVLTGVEGGAGRVVSVTPEEWARKDRTPVLRLNRRGQLKFHWVGPDLAPLPGEEVRQVSRLMVHVP